MNILLTSILGGYFVRKTVDSVFDASPRNPPPTEPAPPPDEVEPPMPGETAARQGVQMGADAAEKDSSTSDALAGALSFAFAKFGAPWLAKRILETFSPTATPELPEDELVRETEVSLKTYPKDGKLAPPVGTGWRMFQSLCTETSVRVIWARETWTQPRLAAVSPLRGDLEDFINDEDSLTDDILGGYGSVARNFDPDPSLRAAPCHCSFNIILPAHFEGAVTVFPQAIFRPTTIETEFARDVFIMQNGRRQPMIDGGKLDAGFGGRAFGVGELIAFFLINQSSEPRQVRFTLHGRGVDIEPGTEVGSTVHVGLSNRETSGEHRAHSRIHVHEALDADPID